MEKILAETVLKGERGKAGRGIDLHADPILVPNLVLTKWGSIRIGIRIKIKSSAV